MKENRPARLGYADFLRCLAAFAVVMVHCSAATLAQEDPASTRFLVLDILHGISRWCVPMFLMISGMFLLDPERPMSRKKWLGHVGRIALALLVWGFAYAFYDTRAAHVGVEWFLEALINMVTGRLHYHLWYLPILLGIYLLLPPMRALVKGASRATLWYLMGIWGVAILGLNTLHTFFPQWVTRTWYDLLGLYCLSTFMGYLLLGYLLKTCRPTRWQEGGCYLLGILGLVVTCAGTWLLSLHRGGLDSRIYEYLTPNVCMTTVALFLLVRRLDLGKHPAWAKIGELTFGVYLIHPLLLNRLQLVGLPDPAWNVAWCVPLEALVLFAASLAVSWVLRKIPKLGNYLC